MVKAKEILEKLFLKKSTPKENWRLKVDENENIYGVSAYMTNAIKSFDFDKISKFPDSSKLLEKLSDKYKRNKDNFILTNGGLEAFNLIISSYLDSNDEILSYNPLDETFITMQKAVFKEIKYSNKYEFKSEDIKKDISQNTKIIYLSNPDIITGEYVKPSLFELLIKEYPDILFVIDCSYINFAQDASLEDYLDLADNCDNTVVIKSFAYDYALLGLKSGFIYAGNDIIQNINKILPSNNVNAFAIYCAYIALNDEKYYEEVFLNNKKARDLLYNGLSEKGFSPKNSDSNFILCDFGDYCDFYYQKLKNNGVLTKKFPSASQYSTCLRITVSKTGGVKYILELLNKKDLLIFNPDNIIFDTKESFDFAILQTFKYFSGYNISPDEITRVKNIGKHNCAWDIVKYLLEERGNYIELDDIMGVFINLVKNCLLDKDKLLFSKEVLDKLSQKYDMVIFTDRLKEHIDYSLKHHEIDKYFNYILSCEDLIIENQKPNSAGLLEILKHCPHKSARYIGTAVDDIIAGNNADIETIGVVFSGETESVMTNNFRHLGAKYILKNIDNVINFLEKK